jgi:hypothetical protein
MIAVLFTGSRYAQIDFAPHKRAIWRALVEIAEMLTIGDGDPTDAILFEGEARGADTIARLSAEHLCWQISPHPADWDGPCVFTGPVPCQPEHRRHYKSPAIKRMQTFCPSAGIRRNQAMVDEITATYPERLCIATPLGAFSVGTQDCIRRARAAGIEVSESPLLPAPTKPRTKPGGTRATT